MAKAEKLYKDSPSIKKDSEGKAGISRPSDADAQDMGIEGNPLPGGGQGMPVEVHQKHVDMLERHQAELKDMQKRHVKEADKLSPSSENEKKD